MSELSEIIDRLGEGFVEFKAAQTERLDELEKRMNRPAAFGGAHSGAGTAEHKALERGVRALLAGSQDADKHFRQAMEESKSMQVGIDPSGGFLVSPQMSATMTSVRLESSPLLGLVRNIDLRSGDGFEEVEDLGSAAAAWVGETQARTDTDTPQIGMLNIPLRELYACPQLSQKMIDTADIDVVDWLTRKIGEQFAFSESEAIFSGDGVIEPRGFLTYPVSASADDSRDWGTIQYIPSGANGAFHTTQADSLIDAVGELKPQYRQGAVWLMGRRTMAKIRKFKTSTAGDAVWVPSLAAGQPPSLLGFPVIEDEHLPEIGADSLSIAFGNPARFYTTVRRIGLRLLSDPYSNKPFVRIYAYERIGGGLHNSEAVKLIRFSAT